MDKDEKKFMRKAIRIREQCGEIKGGPGAIVVKERKDHRPRFRTGDSHQRPHRTHAAEGGGYTHLQSA